MGGLSELDHEHDDLGFELLEESEIGSEGSDSEEEESGDLEESLNEEDSGEDLEEERIAKPSATPAAVVGGGKYVPPAIRRAQLVAAGAAGGARVEDERIIRRVRGLLNRLAETNLPGIVG